MHVEKNEFLIGPYLLQEIDKPAEDSRVRSVSTIFRGKAVAFSSHAEGYPDCSALVQAIFRVFERQGTPRQEGQLLCDVGIVSGPINALRIENPEILGKRPPGV